LHATGEFVVAARPRDGFGVLPVFALTIVNDAASPF